MSEPKPMDGHVVACLPFFPGMYESILSSAIDEHETREAEYMAEREIPVPRKEPEPFQLTNEESEQGWYPEHLRITASEYSELFFKLTDYQKVHLQLAQMWVESFDWWCKENIGTPEKSFIWESMTSPREYNFATDRAFAYVPTSVVEMLFERSAKEEHKTLAEVIKDTFTSYSGFISFYSNDLDEWLAKPLEDWDYNEIGTLIAASIKASDEYSSRADFSWAIYEILFSGNGEEERAIDAGMDWPKFEEKVKELRVKKLAEHEASVSN